MNSEEIIQILKSADIEKKCALIKQLEDKPIEDAQKFLELAANDSDLSVRYYAKKALKRFALPDDTEKKEAIENLQPLSNKTKINTIALVKYLQSDDPKKKIAAALAVFKLNEQKAYKHLVDALGTEQDKHVIATYVKTIGMLGKDKAVKIISKFLEDPDDRVRANTIEGLSYAGGKKVIELLVPKLRDENNRVRANAAKAMVKHGQTEVFETLDTMLKSEEIWMRDSAIYALGEIGNKNAVQLLCAAFESMGEDLKIAILKSLAKIKKGESTEFLKKTALSDSSKKVSAYARHILETNGIKIEIPEASANESKKEQTAEHISEAAEAAKVASVPKPSKKLNMKVIYAIAAVFILILGGVSAWLLMGSSDSADQKPAVTARKQTKQRKPAEVKKPQNNTVADNTMPVSEPEKKPVKPPAVAESQSQAVADTKPIKPETKKPEPSVSKPPVPKIAIDETPVISEPVKPLETKPPEIKQPVLSGETPILAQNTQPAVPVNQNAASDISKNTSAVSDTNSVTDVLKNTDIKPAIKEPEVREPEKLPVSETAQNTSELSKPVIKASMPRETIQPPDTKTVQKIAENDEEVDRLIRETLIYSSKIKNLANTPEEQPEESPAPIINTRKKIMVVYFKNDGFDKYLDIFSKGIADTFISNFALISGMDVVPRHEFQAQYEKYGLEVKTIYTRMEVVRKIARDLKCDYILAGSVKDLSKGYDEYFQDIFVGQLYQKESIEKWAYQNAPVEIDRTVLDAYADGEVDKDQPLYRNIINITDSQQVSQLSDEEADELVKRYYTKGKEELLKRDFNQAVIDLYVARNIKQDSVVDTLYNEASEKLLALTQEKKEEYEKRVLRLEIMANLLDIKSGKAVETWRERGNLIELYPMMKRIGHGVLKDLGIEMTAYVAKIFFRNSVSDMAALMNTYRFLGYFDDYMHKNENKTANYNNAKRALDEALKIDPDFAQAYFLRSRLNSEKDINNAINDLQKASNLSPENFLYKRVLAFLYEKKGEVDTANKILKEIVRITGEGEGNATIGAHLQLASNYFQSGNVYRAMKELTTAWELDKNNPYTLMFMAYYEITQANLDSALQHLNKVISINSDVKIALLLRGDILLRQDAIDSAVNDFTRGEKLVQQSANDMEKRIYGYGLFKEAKEEDFLYRLGKAFLTKGNVNLAREYFTRIMKNYPYTKIAEQAEQQLLINNIAY